MVADKEGPRRKNFTASRCLKHTDDDGLHYIVPEEPHSKGASPRVDVWWNRGPRKRVTGDARRNYAPRAEQSEELIIRQENGRVGADVLIITHGQAYDLIDALTQAVENP